MSFSERVEELNQEIGATVERAISDLRRQLAERLRASNEQILRQVEELVPSLPPHFLAHEHVAPFADEASASARQSARHAAFSELRDGLVGIDGARSQTEVLTALLGAAGHFASRSAVLLLRAGEVRGWGAHGFAVADTAAVRGLAFTAPTNGGWEQVTGGHGAVRLSAAECADLCSRLESPLPQDGVIVPLILRDQLAAVLYADSGDRGDSGDGHDTLNLEALQTLTYVAAQAIELLPLRQRASTATLQQAGQNGDAAAVVAPAPAPAPEPPPAAPEPPAEAHSKAPAEAAPEPEPEPEPEQHASQEGGETATSEVRWPAPVPPLPPMPAPPEPVEEEEHGDPEIEALPSLSELPEVEATPAWEEEPSPWAVPEPEPESETENLAPLPLEPEPATAAPRPEETVLLQRPSFEPPPAHTPADEAPETEPSYPRPVPPIASPAGFEAPAAQAAPAEPERAGMGGGGNPEVRPPSDVEGPGWAFATTRVPVSPDDAELHESARRLARLLVSEIKLYNEDQVEEGRRNRDIYERLKEDIDRSRQMYEERVEPKVWKSTDYFYQELVRILASGDSRALGI